MFIDMLNHKNFDTMNYTSLSTGIMAGAPCPIEVCKQVVTKLHMKDFCVPNFNTFTTLQFFAKTVVQDSVWYN